MPKQINPDSDRQRILAYIKSAPTPVTPAMIRSNFADAGTPLDNINAHLAAFKKGGVVIHGDGRYTAFDSNG